MMWGGWVSGKLCSIRCMVKMRRRGAGMVLSVEKWVESSITPILFIWLRVGMMATPELSSIDAQKMVS